MLGTVLQTRTVVGVTGIMTYLRQGLRVMHGIRLRRLKKFNSIIVDAASLLNGEKQ